MVTRFRIAFPSREDLRRRAFTRLCVAPFALSRPEVATLPIRAHAFAQRIHQVNYMLGFSSGSGASITWPLALRCTSLRSAFSYSSLNFSGSNLVALLSRICAASEIISLLIRGDGICEKYSFSFRTS